MQNLTTLLTEAITRVGNRNKKSRGIEPLFSVRIRKQRATEANIQANHVLPASAQEWVNTEIKQKRRSPIIEG